jgi:hypothetical protein
MDRKESIRAYKHNFSKHSIASMLYDTFEDYKTLGKVQKGKIWEALRKSGYDTEECTSIASIVLDAIAPALGKHK